jgi:hypothetical protein
MNRKFRLDKIVKLVIKFLGDLCFYVDNISCRSAKYTDDPVLLFKEATELQRVIGTLIEIARGCGMAVIVENTKVMKIL